MAQTLTNVIAFALTCVERIIGFSPVILIYIGLFVALVLSLGGVKRK